MGVVRLRPVTEESVAGADVTSLAARLDDAALVHALRRGDQSAAGELFDRFAPRVRRVILRVLGADQDLPDLVQDVFVHALRDIDKLAEPAAVSGWLVGIAVNVARRTIRRRTRWRWLRPTAPEELSEVAAPGIDNAASEQLRAVYSILDQLPVDERVPFALRFIEGMELKEVARACDVSLATIKRRLKKAETSFRARAKRHPALLERLGGDR